MEWYHSKAPPFSEGKKSEFPDAVALASLLDYQRKLKAPIAVISHDPDFRQACERYSELYYFQSLAAFTEVTKSADKRIETIRNALITKEEEIWKEIERLFSEAGFVLSDHWDADIQDPEIVSKSDVDYHVVSLGESVCTVAFEAEIEFSVQASYDDMDNAFWDGGEAFPFDTIERSYDETARISGTLKLRITPDGASVIKVTHTFLDQRDFTISSEYRDY